ncbi:hypothetical protein DR950_01520 [Kitasatospora xanthocidica]|uniref:Uncharacterized protein n=1 Tax=Kitasatospora xanthocidica TaxID=83382 RepID=A0A372ZL98_9ACTN|nr:hypothetical protein [Kitasatospora xanthocidica]RGD56648.1 hypothetical protein DR950_01520 [Kitasatospora xanthocidica]
MKKLLKDVATSLVYLVVMLVNPLLNGVQSLRAHHWPTERRKLRLIGSPTARAARAAERERIRALVEALGAVEGVEHLLTQVLDQSTRPSTYGLDHPRDTLLVCRIHARAYFVVREDVLDVLRRIEAANVADWQANGQGPDPHGSLEHALRWYRDGGVDANGWRMDPPCLSSPGAKLTWDRPGIPPRDPIPAGPYPNRLFVLEQTPPDADAARLLDEARADGRGVVLELAFGAGWVDYCQYHKVARGGFAGRGRL